MKFNKLFVLLALFMLILSAAAVSAEDTIDPVGDAADDNDDLQTDAAYNESDEDAQDNETDDEIDDGEYNETEDGMLVDAAYAEGSASVDEGAPATSTSNLDKNAAGNPVLILLAAIAGIGLTTLKRR